MKIATFLLGLLTTAFLFVFLKKEELERESRYTGLLRTKLQNLTSPDPDYPDGIPLSRTYYVLGRRERKCDIVIGGEGEHSKEYDKTVSRVHAVLRFDGEAWRLAPVPRTDGEGYTLLRVNHRQIGPEGAVLRPVEDVITIGQSTLRLTDADAGKRRDPRMKTRFHALARILTGGVPYVLSILLTLAFLFATGLDVLSRLPENAEAYRTSMILAACVLVGAEIWMCASGWRFHAMMSAVTVLLGIGASYQHLFGNDTRCLHHMILFYVSASVMTALLYFFFWIPPHPRFERVLFRALCAVTVSCLAITLLFGVSQGGARLWFRPLKSLPTVQLTEFLKPVLVLVGAMSYRNNSRIIIYSAISLASCGILLALSDFGDAAVIFVAWLCGIFILWDARLLSGGILIATLTAFFYMLSLFPHARERFARWFHVMQSGEAAAEQQQKMIKALLFGGLRGAGTSNATFMYDFRRIPSISKDMALSGIWAVYGLPLLLAAVLAYTLIILQAIHNRGVYPASHLILTQASVILFCQVVLNFGGSVDLLPFTGIVAPLITRGGSAMVAFGLLFGTQVAALNPKARSREPLPREGDTP